MTNVSKNIRSREYPSRVLSDHAVWIYMMLLKIVEQDMQTMIVPAILENTGIDVNSSGGGMRSGGEIQKQKPLDTLLRKLDITYNLLCSYGLDVEVINQVFRQLFYYVCAGALNNLLLRRELCNWSKGLEIRYNISALEECAEGVKKMERGGQQTLSPCYSSKSDFAGEKVVKLLNLYSSKDGVAGDKVSKQFIERVQSKLFETRTKGQEQQEALAKTKLLMDTQYTYAVKFPFNPSSVKLEDINIPDSFGLNQWIKKM
ncbi:Unconventional myosin-Va [Orchesella cincta]|uniref:Unconventional myosin-Va n=1 Tax=Orchesella cincta TaxID=48709 RepID=A0A1D2MN78_ORCCI|nr:Unconventional myosin-Va [Orchesella cincta]